MLYNIINQLLKLFNLIIHPSVHRLNSIFKLHLILLDLIILNINDFIDFMFHPQILNFLINSM